MSAVRNYDMEIVYLLMNRGSSMKIRNEKYSEFVRPGGLLKKLTRTLLLRMSFISFELNAYNRWLTFVPLYTGRHNFDEMMIDRLSEVLTCILRNLHDPNFEIPANSILPIPTPFVSNENLVRETIVHFQVRVNCLKFRFGGRELDCILLFDLYL